MTPTPLAHCQLGFRPESPKPVTLVPPAAEAGNLPDAIPFYVRPLLRRLPRTAPTPEAWQGGFFPWPFDLERGRLQPERGEVLLQGILRRDDSRWGPVWRGAFDAFREERAVQVETDFGSSFPITIRGDLYERLQRGFLHFLSCQRSGQEVPGVRPAEHLDDGVLDSTGEQIDAVGGWYDAGDLRKWMFLTQPNLGTLAGLVHRGHPAFADPAREEIRWGNRFFHRMIAPDGQVWEDLGGGNFKAGLSMEEDWWYENHPGCGCDSGGCVYTDNRPGSGDERIIRTTYNPAVQFLFVRTQCQVADVLPEGEADRCRQLAARAWDYGRRRGHDGRTLFLATEAYAALEALQGGLPGVSSGEVRTLFATLLERQDRGEEGLSGAFMEKDHADGFRCIAYAEEPGMALLRLVERPPEGLEDLAEAATEALHRHIERFLLADANSNPFHVTPYGLYLHPPLPEHQRFRDAGRGRGVRTFIHPFSRQQIVHGTGAVILHQAAFLAKAGHLLDQQPWKEAAEHLVQWSLGHNPEGLCLHHGVGYRHPVPFSGYCLQVPDAMSVGHIGRPDDRPYLETSPLIEWSSQEIWDVHHAHLVETVLWL